MTKPRSWAQPIYNVSQWGILFITHL
jgi:hypothetical protein